MFHARLHQNQSSEQVSLLREMSAQHRVSLFLRSRTCRFTSHTFEEILRYANELIGREYYTLQQVGSIADLSFDGPQSRDRNTIIIVGDRDNRLVLPDEELSVLKARLPGYSRIGLVGGAVFVANAVGLVYQSRLAVSGEISSAAVEAGSALVSAPFSNGKRVHSAVNGFAAQRMLIGMIANDLGEQIAQAIEEFVGLGVKDTAPKSLELQKLFQKAEGNQIVIEALELMEANIEERLSCGDISEILGVSNRQIERLFKKYFRFSPNRIYKVLRLARANQLLRNTDLSISEIAIACGYTTLNHFVRNYRERYACTPSSTRERRYGGIARPC